MSVEIIWIDWINGTGVVDGHFLILSMKFYDRCNECDRFNRCESLKKVWFFQWNFYDWWNECNRWIRWDRWDKCESIRSMQLMSNCLISSMTFSMSSEIIAFDGIGATDGEILILWIKFFRSMKWMRSIRSAQMMQKLWFYRWTFYDSWNDIICIYRMYMQQGRMFILSMKFLVSDEINVKNLWPMKRMRFIGSMGTVRLMDKIDFIDDIFMIDDIDDRWNLCDWNEACNQKEFIDFIDERSIWPMVVCDGWKIFDFIVEIVWYVLWYLWDRFENLIFELRFMLSMGLMRFISTIKFIF